MQPSEAERRFGSRLTRPLSRWTRGMFLLAGVVAALSAGEPTLIAPENRLAAGAPEWRELTERFARRGDVAADFEEKRYFPFRAAPVALRGEVRVSRERGLSLHYAPPQERTLIIDAQGLLIREPAGGNSAPLDPRANAANDALRHVLAFDFAALAAGYELYGWREGEAWSLGLVPRDPGVRRAIGNILVSGEGDAVRRIELRRSAKQHIDIVIAAPRPAAAFSAEELARYFR